MMMFQIRNRRAERRSSASRWGLAALLGALGCASPPVPRWSAPAEAAARKTPVGTDPQTADAGKAVFLLECRECHGNLGRGDGPSAWMLRRPPIDLGGAFTQRRSDGELFWKVSEGDEEMPDFKRKLPELERWQLVAYLRTLGTER